MPQPIPTSELKTYKGNCHCGAFKFSIKIPELTSVTECNCSICFKKRYMWVAPGAGCFTIEKGEGSLKDYEFGKRSMSHKVCSFSQMRIKLMRGLSVVLPYVRYGCHGEETRCDPGDGYWGQCKAPPHYPIPHAELTLDTTYRPEHCKMSISGL
jgi:hypothetical protein